MRHRHCYLITALIFYFFSFTVFPLFFFWGMIVFALTVKAKAQQGFDFSRSRCLYKWISETKLL